MNNFDFKIIDMTDGGQPVDKKFSIRRVLSAVVIITGSIFLLSFGAIALGINLEQKRIAAFVPDKNKDVVVDVLVNESELAAVNKFNPEIPVNEYWHFSEQRGDNFGGFQLYINNTDKNVIYALNDSGKIAWTIWGKNYGFISSPEIRQVRNHLFITAMSHDKLKNYINTLWVFDENGQLAWKQVFVGYIDMPQMHIIPKGYVILENRSTQSCDSGCGILCSEKPENKCGENSIWAFDINTGNVIWKNTTRNYYGTYFDSVNDEELIAHSGGVGAGRFLHTYVIDSETGVFTKHYINLVDAEKSEDNSFTLIYNHIAKKISLVKTAGNGFYDFQSTMALWSVSAGSSLYDLTDKHIDDGQLAFRTLKKLILAYELDTAGNVITYAFSRENGKLLWKTDLDSKEFQVHTQQSFDNTIVFVMNYKSVCSYGCPHDSWVCIETDEMARAYNDCRTAEMKKDGFNSNEIIGVNAFNGKIIWRQLSGSKIWYLNKKIDTNAGMVNLLEFNENTKNEEILLIDPKTGEFIEKN